MKQTLRSWNSTLRRSPMKPISRDVEWQARKPLKPVSDKRKAENRQRSKVLAELKAKFPMCQRCHERPSVDGHELKRRSAAGSITDENNIRMVCRMCHEWIGMHPVEAIKEGFARSRYA